MLTACVGVAIASWVLVASVHVHDRFHVDHVSGAWMALAKYANAGVLYPPLYDGHAYGGTRYMPMKILSDALAARASGEYLTSGKVIGFVVFALLTALLVTALRKAGCRLSVALALAAIPLLTENGFFAATSNYGDALPVVFQIAAVVLIAGAPNQKAALFAGCLCGLAFFSKFSAVWAGPAIVVWLAVFDRRLLSRFIAAWLGSAALLVGSVELLTDGRFGDNVWGLGGAGFAGVRTVVADAPHKAADELFDVGGAMFVICGVVALSYVFAIARRRWTIYHLCLPLAALVLLVVLADVGAESNHLLDVEVLAVLVAGVSLRGAERFALATASALAIALAWLYVANVLPATRDAASGDGSWPARPVAAYVSPDDSLLSEDASIPVSLGRLPVVLDPFMLLRLDEEHPEWGAALVRRLDRHEFDTIVMNGRPTPTESWWRTHHFGPRIAAAIFRNYRRGRVLQGYSIYVPR